ncbi:MAG: hypothetical protein RIQ62_862 [Bacteroidota bacterium]
MLRLFSVFCVLCFLFPVSAWTIGKDSMQAVQIRSTRKPILSPPIQEIDSSTKPYYQLNSLQQLLERHSNVFLRNYGVGNVSTLSIRGSSAAQTQVLWNGININSAMSGLSDFSNLPVSFFDQIRIDYSGNQQETAVGGSILLGDDKTVYQSESKLKVSSAFESLRNLSAAGEYRYATSRVSNRVKVFVTQAENRYSFYNPDKQREDTVLQAGVGALHILDRFAFRGKKGNEGIVQVWAFWKDREIPAASFETYRPRTDQNQALRSAFNWGHTLRQRYRYEMKVAALYEGYSYQDNGLSIRSHSASWQMPWQHQLKTSIRQHEMECRAGSLVSVLIPERQHTIYGAHVELIYSNHRFWKYFQGSARIKREWNNRFSLPWSGSVQINATLPLLMHAYLQMSSTYRMPTLNELFFDPGGNPNLQPEKSKSIEVGLQADSKPGKHSFHCQLAAFHRRVNDWIVWYGSSVLTPHNIQEVWSRGIEWSSSFSRRLTHSHAVNWPDTMFVPKSMDIKQQQSRFWKEPILFGNLFYAYTLSTTQASALVNDYSLGKQIPYVPRYAVKAELGIRTSNWECRYLQTYTGYRFITTDESQYLPPYFTGNVFFSYQIHGKKGPIRIQGGVNNLFGARYESVRGRFMPGRNWSIALTYH